MKIKIKGPRGELVDHDSDEPIPDGHGVVTSMLVMDSTQAAIAHSRSTMRHRPGSEIAAELFALGHANSNGVAFSKSSIKSMLEG